MTKWTAERIIRLMGLVYFVVSAVLFVLWVRVVLECIIVIFNIAETLTSIDKSLAAPNAPE